MGRVSPIKSQTQIAQMREYLNDKSERDYMMFVMGINLGLRIGDLTKIKVGQVLGSHLYLIEEKREKRRECFINAQLRKELDIYIESRGLQPQDYLFQSRKGENQHISRSRAYRILNEAADVLGIERVGTHTLRKTFGYWHYRQYKDVAMLQTIFRHSSPSETLRYIGIEQDEIDAFAKDFFL